MPPKPGEVSEPLQPPYASLDPPVEQYRGALAEWRQNNVISDEAAEKDDSDSGADESAVDTVFDCHLDAVLN
jgi:hypothetical protein